MGGWELSELYLKCCQMGWRCQWWRVWNVRNISFGVWFNMWCISFGQTWGSHVSCEACGESVVSRE